MPREAALARLGRRGAHNVHAAIQLAAGFDIDRATGDAAINSSASQDVEPALGKEVAFHRRVNLNLVRMDLVHELNIRAFLNNELTTMNFTDDGA